MIKRFITLSEAKKSLEYDPWTGEFKRLRRGQKVGSLSSEGYRVISVNGLAYKASHLAWLFFFGSYPTLMIDHINMNPSDDRIVNLRLATSFENMANRLKQKDNKTGYKGVSKHEKGFRAQIGVGGKVLKLGTFRTALEAHEAYCEAAKKYHGKFARFS